MPETNKIQTVFHPDYKVSISDWRKFRLAYTGGRPFIEEYLVKYTKREGKGEFKRRRSLTYSPSHAKATVNDVQNSLFERFTDIDRFDGPDSYQRAVHGLDDGVDLQGNTMNGFVGREVLPELLVMSKVGVYVDRANLNPQSLVASTRNDNPYLYIYHAEDIRSWAVDSNGILTAVLLCDHYIETDELTGVAIDERDRYRLLKLTDEGVQVKVYRRDASSGEYSDIEEYLLEGFDRIPFVIAEISQSLMTDIADHQIALLNLASSDLGYSLNANFPLYIEQEDPAANFAHNLQSDLASDGTSSDASVAKDRTAGSGTIDGRSYPRGLEAPSFINPSAEPLVASMKKQEQITIEIRQLVNLSISSLVPMRASAESKEQDDKGLESGLAKIGLELEYLERQIAIVWAMYENSSPASVKYPTQYSLKDDKARRDEANEILDTLGKVPSITFQKQMAKKAVDLLTSSSAPAEKVQEMFKEIEKADVIVIDSGIISTDIENGLVDTQTASLARLYPRGSSEKAQEEKIVRLALISQAQSKDDAPMSAARGVKEADVTGDDAKLEKKASQDSDLTGEDKNKTRGDA